MKTKGFTLIEILIVISIMVIVTGAVVINSITSKDNVNLYSTKNSIAMSINKAKEIALSGVGATIGKNYGVGVWFPDSAGKYYYIYKNYEDLAEYKGYDTGDVILEKVILPDGIRYEINTNLGVLFTPPKPSVSICSAAATCNGSVFTLNVYAEANPDKIETLTVNKAGLVEINE
ncbi:MAG: type II secretion system protein [Candidatus Pacebacteria bacterium]|nr:type II secretion system protein [Candidatus Paceibacterota bacterium]